MKRFTMLKGITALAVLSLVAAACAQDGDGGQAGGQAEQTCDADEFGCVEIAQGEPITLGTLLVITGPDASLGQDSQNGAVLALDFMGQDPWPGEEGGSILGHPVEFIHQDDGCSAEGGQAGATALAAEEQVVAVLGTSCSSAALGVADEIMSREGIPLISPSNTGPQLTDEETHQPFYLRTAHNDFIQGAAVAQFASEEQGFQTAVTIHDGSPYADGLQQAFADSFTEVFGGEILAQEAIQVGETDFGPLLTQIAQDPPDLLYYPIFVDEGGAITEQARGTPGLEDTALAGSDGMFTPDWIKAAGAENAEGAFISGPDLTAFANPEFYEGEFLPAYEEKFGQETTAVFHAHSFDAVMMLTAAIEEVAIQEGGTTFIPRTELRDRLLETENFPGITGNLTCNELGDCQQVATMGIVTVENGDFTDPVFSQEIRLEDVLPE